MALCVWRINRRLRASQRNQEGFDGLLTVCHVFHHVDLRRIAHKTVTSRAPSVEIND